DCFRLAEKSPGRVDTGGVDRKGQDLAAVDLLADNPSDGQLSRMGTSGVQARVERARHTLDRLQAQGTGPGGGTGELFRVEESEHANRSHELRAVVQSQSFLCLQH